jgi:uncharacterized tellurite resistance protein B-like protein
VIDAFRRFFATNLAPAAPAAGDSRLAIATCALLLEAAQADDEVTADEREAIVALLRQRFGLGEPEGRELVALAEAERARSTSLFPFTQRIAEAYDEDGRRAVLEAVWRVIYADGRLEAREDALIHRLAHMLGLSHGDLIALKLRVKGAGGAPAGGG